MNLRVTILALAAHRECRIWSRELGMTHLVTFETQARARELQRVLVHRAVRIMAIQAVLTYRFVLEQKRSALFGVAGVTDVVDRIFLQQRFREAAVRIMAIRAHHLAFAQWHVRGAEHLRAPILMALETGVRLKCGL